MDWLDWIDGLHELAEQDAVKLDEDESYRPNWEAGQTPEECVQDEEDSSTYEEADKEADEEDETIADDEAEDEDEEDEEDEA